MTRETKNPSKLRQYIDSKGISPLKMAVDLEIPYSSIYQTVQGYNDPSLERVRKFMQYLGCKFEDIF
jgi:predicted transcriptional regulator